MDEESRRQTTPHGETIPVPERDDVLRFFRKAAGVSADDTDASDDRDGAGEDEQP